MLLGLCIYGNPCAARPVYMRFQAVFNLNYILVIIGIYRMIFSIIIHIKILFIPNNNRYILNSDWYIPASNLYIRNNIEYIQEQN